MKDNAAKNKTAKAKCHIDDIQSTSKHAFISAYNFVTAETSATSATTAKGHLRYHKIIELIRSGLLSQGWKIHNVKNMPLIISPNSEIVLLIRTGNKFTGLQNINLSSPNDGKLSQTAQEFYYGEQTNIPLPSATKVMMLLYRYDGNLIFSELSTPQELDNKGKILSWEDRICLPVIDTNALEVDKHSTEYSTSQEENSEIDLNIKRKQAKK